MIEAHEISPRDPRVIYSLGETYVALKDWDKAQQFLDQMQAIVPGHPRGYQLKAAIASQRDRNYRSAARDLELASADLSFFCWPIFNALVQAGDFRKAQNIESCDVENKRRGEPLTADLASGLALRFAGNLEAGRSRLNSARADIESRLEDDPEDFFVNLSMCMVEGGLGNVEDALQACRTAESRLFADAFARNNLKVQIAYGFALGGVSGEALRLLEEALDDGLNVSAQTTADHPAFMSLHDDARWQQLMKRHGVTVPPPWASDKGLGASE